MPHGICIYGTVLNSVDTVERSVASVFNPNYREIVGNPPHFRNVEGFRKYCPNYVCSDIDILKTLDKDFNLHRRFYLNVRGYLRPGGNVIFVENSEASNANDFMDMIREGLY